MMKIMMTITIATTTKAKNNNNNKRKRLSRAALIQDIFLGMRYSTCND
jgi:hypothetical protein